LADFIDFDPQNWELVFSNGNLFDLVKMHLFQGTFCPYSDHKSSLCIFLLNALKTKATSKKLPKKELFGVVYLSLQSQTNDISSAFNQPELLALLVKHSNQEFELLDLEQSSVFNNFVLPLLQPLSVDE
jgi:hypothetical protein